MIWTDRAKEEVSCRNDPLKRNDLSLSYANCKRSEKKVDEKLPIDL